MITTTATEIHQTIAAALGDRAQICRKRAAGRPMSGSHLADQRAQLRAEAKRCEELQRILGHVSPGELASALAAKPAAR